MKLEDVTMEIRPRSDLEAIDSGFGLARRDFWRCLALWWMAFFPMFLLLPVLRSSPEWWMFLALWWKLTGSRLISFQLSRRLFGEQPTWRQLWRELPQCWFRRFFYRMCWARLSPWKGASMIVEDLEGLRGKAYADRVRMVLRRGEGSFMLLYFLSMIGTVALTAGLMKMGETFMPQEYTEEPTYFDFFSEEEAEPMTLGMKWAMAGAWTLAAALIDVFFTGAGFGLYINSRAWIEGWDIELAFKRLANRINGTMQVLLMGCLIFTATMVHGAEAKPTGLVKESAQERIERIKADPAFTIHKEKYKVLKENSSTSYSGGLGSGLGAGFFDILGIFGQILLGLFIAALLALIGWLIYRSRILGGLGAVKIRDAPKASVVMGMQVNQESLPDDPVAVARKFWDEGKYAAALGMLYRASLSWWIHHGGVEIRESDTEGDCLRRVRVMQNPAVGYFEILTQQWIRGAYADQMPATESWNELCEKWPFQERRVVR